MTLRDYLRVFRERWKLIVSLLLLAVALGVLATALTPKRYESTAQVFVATNGNSDPIEQFQAAAFAQAQVATYANLIHSPDVRKAVNLDINTAYSPSQFKSEISAAAETGKTLVDITATDASPDQAARVANSTATAFVAAIQKYTTPPKGLPVNGKAAKQPTPAVHLSVTGPAEAASSPSTPNALLNISVSIIVGVLVGLAAAVLREVVDNRVKDPDALAKVAGTPLMGVVVEDPKAERHPIATRAGTRNARAENFRQLRANLQFANVDHHPRVIAITSSIPSEGKTMVAMNLASTLAEAGFTVCLVDADLRRPTVAKVMGLPGPVGLTNVLVHQMDLSEALQSAGANLFVLSSGPTPPNPSEVLASTYIRDVIRSLLDRVDYVVIDTAPLLPVADGSEVAALADGTLLVGRYKLTTDSQVRRAVATLKGVDAKLIGVVLNRMTNTRNREYGYGYSYYRAETTSVQRPGPQPASRFNRSRGQSENVKTDA